MTDDIARIGLTVDSSQVATGKTALDAFAASAGPAAAGATNFQRAAAGAGAQAAQVARGAGLARHEMVNLGRQAQDVGTMLAMGASPFSILASQGAQVFDIFSSSQGPLRGFAAQLASIITPARVLGASLTAAGAAAYFLDRAAKSTLITLDDTARATGATISQIDGLERAATTKGIENFGQAAQRWAGDIYDAGNNAGRLAELLKANNLQAGSFVDTLGRVADLVRNAATDQQRIQILRQSGLPSDLAWVRYMQQGGDAIRKAADQAGTFGTLADQELVRKAREASEAWNKGWDDFARGGQRAILNVGTWYDWLINKTREITFNEIGQRAVGRNMLRNGLGSPTMGGSDAKEFYNGVGRSRWTAGPDEGSPTIDLNAAKARLQMEQPRLGMVGTLAPVKATEKPAPKDEPDSREAERDCDHRRRAA